MNGDLNMATFYLRNQADVNARIDDGSSALMNAALNSQIEMTKLLLSFNADKSITRIPGMRRTANAISAFSIARSTSHTEILKLLTNSQN